MKTSEKLIRVIRALGIADEATPILVKRVYAGWAQRSREAWSWGARHAETYVEICGSCDSMADVVRAHREGRISILTSFGIPSLIVENSPVKTDEANDQ